MEVGLLESLGMLTFLYRCFEARHEGGSPPKTVQVVQEQGRIFKILRGYDLLVDGSWMIVDDREA
jgi:hypothetical protein